MLIQHRPYWMRLLGAALMALCAGLAHAAPPSRSVVVEPLPTWAKITAVDTAPMPTALQQVLAPLSAYIERWDTSFHVAGGQSQRVERQVVRVQQPAALSELGTLRIAFNPDYQSVQVHTARILRGNVQIDMAPKLEWKVAQVETQLSQMQLTGRSLAIAQVDGLQVGDRLEWAYSISGVNPVFGNAFSAEVAMDAPLPVLQRQVRVSYPSSTEVYYRQSGPQANGSMEVRESASASERELLFTQRALNIPRLDNLVPRNYEYLTTLQISTAPDWKSVRQWAQTLFPPTRSAPSIAKAAADIRKSASQTLAQVERAVQLVQDDIRYFSVAISEGTHRPAPPEVTLSRRFGDCKDKSYLLVALLRELGVKSSVALVSTTSGPNALGRLPSPLAFDHAIVRIELPNAQVVFADPTRTGNGVPLLRQTQALSANIGLVIGGPADEGLVLMGTHAPSTVLDIRERIEATSLDKPAVLEAKTTLRDSTAENWRRLDSTRTTLVRDQYLLDLMQRRYPQATPTPGWPRLQDVKQDNRIDISESYSLSGWIAGAGEAQVARFNASQLLAALIQTMPSKDRPLPLALTSPGNIWRYRVDVQLPAHITGREDPADDQLNTPHFKLRTHRAFRGNHFEFSAEIEVLASEVASTDMARFVSSLESARTKFLDILVITPDHIAHQDAPATSVGQRQEEQMRALLATTAKVVEANRLAAAEMAELHVARAAAYSDVGDSAQAEIELQRAFKLQPSSANATKLRGHLLARQGLWAQAETQFTRALSLGAPADGGYLARGQMRYLRGNYAEAAQDFAQALSASEQGHNSGFTRVWQALALLRLGKVAEMPVNTSTWPLPLLAVITGRTSPQALERELERIVSDEERILNQCEGYFYLALWFAARNDEAASQRYLQKTLATGIRSYTEYGLAEGLLSQRKP